MYANTFHECVLALIERDIGVALDFDLEPQRLAIVVLYVSKMIPEETKRQSPASYSSFRSL
jgi:hypothetical protein